MKDTDGYSCADLKLLCKEAWMTQLRPVWTYLENKQSPLKEFKNDERINDLSYILNALKIVKPIVHSTRSKYEVWDRSFTKESNNQNID